MVKDWTGQAGRLHRAGAGGWRLKVIFRPVGVRTIWMKEMSIAESPCNRAVAQLLWFLQARGQSSSWPSWNACERICRSERSGVVVNDQRYADWCYRF